MSSLPCDYIMIHAIKKIKKLFVRRRFKKRVTSENSDATMHMVFFVIIVRQMQHPWGTSHRSIVISETDEQGLRCTWNTVMLAHKRLSKFFRSQVTVLSTFSSQNLHPKRFMPRMLEKTENGDRMVYFTIQQTHPRRS